MVSIATRLDARAHRATRAAPAGVVVICPTGDERGARLSEEAIRRWQDAVVREQLPGVRTVLFLPEKDGDR